MTDNELTSLAVKAYGHAPDGFSPLTDDGDALRLAVKLNLDVWRGTWPSGKRYVAAHRVWDVNDSMYYDDGVTLGDDPYAATRRAIVRAAAEIGRAMP